VAAGRLVVLPTDTVYGIGARPDDPSATTRLFEAKRRPTDLELPVLVPNAEAASSVARIDDRGITLIEAFWPGPLTLVLPRAQGSEGWELGGDPRTIGIRQPRHLMAMALLGRTGPLAVTSANISGRPPAATCDQLVEIFDDLVEIYLCQDDPLSGQASTVVDLVHRDVTLLRRGAVPEREIRAALAKQ
jgi:L-threonylcarbamoyladenylate synthase